MTIKIEEMPPLDLPAMAKWLQEAADIATIARDSQYADRMLLINLMAALHKAGLLDAEDMLKTMAKSIPLIDGENYKLAARLLVDECFSALHPRTSSAPAH